MSDFHLTVGVHRGDMVEALQDNDELAYVLCEVADGHSPGTASFDNLMDDLMVLPEDRKHALLAFCARVQEQLLLDKEPVV